MFVRKSSQSHQTFAFCLFRRYRNRLFGDKGIYFLIFNLRLFKTTLDKDCIILPVESYFAISALKKSIR